MIKQQDRGIAPRPDVDDSMTVGTLMRQPTGYLPVAMSVGAFAMIVWFVAGTAS